MVRSKRSESYDPRLSYPTAGMEVPIIREFMNGRRPWYTGLSFRK
ncbi:UNVERIFIED_CONTAM: hypothetical protein N8J90_02160 [Halobacillus marinus]